MQGPPSQFVADPSLVEDFKRLSQDSLNELDAALLVAQVVDASVNTTRVRQQIKTLEDAARSQGTVDVEGMLAMLRNRGFAQTYLTDVDPTIAALIGYCAAPRFAHCRGSIGCHPCAWARPAR